MVEARPDVIAGAWAELDADGPATVIWLREVPSARLALLLGAFDPPTNAHVAMARAVRRTFGMHVALCMTKVLLDRPDDGLLDPVVRLELLDEVCSLDGFGLVIANRGTYLDVGRALRAQGRDPVFIVGADKLAQLEDPAFYDRGEQGVADTFSELDFIVVPRGEHRVRRARYVLMLDDPRAAEISATEVRRKVRAGGRVSDLVPPGVDLALQGYTSAR